MNKYREVKSGLLTMLEESNLDYSVTNSLVTDRSCRITVSRNGQGIASPDFNVVLSASPNMLAVRVNIGNGHELLENTRYINGESNSGEETVLRWLTELIENIENGLDVTGSPRKAQA